MPQLYNHKKQRCFSTFDLKGCPESMVEGTVLFCEVRVMSLALLQLKGGHYLQPFFVVLYNHKARLGGSHIKKKKKKN